MAQVVAEEPPTKSGDAILENNDDVSTEQDSAIETLEVHSLRRKLPKYRIWCEVRLIRLFTILFLLLDAGVIGTVYVLSHRYYQVWIIYQAVMLASWIVGALLFCHMTIIAVEYCSGRRIAKLTESTDEVKFVSSPLDQDPDYLELLMSEAHRRHFWMSRRIDIVTNLLTSVSLFCSGAIIALGGAFIVYLKALFLPAVSSISSSYINP